MDDDTNEDHSYWSMMMDNKYLLPEKMISFYRIKLPENEGNIMYGYLKHGRNETEINNIPFYTFQYNLIKYAVFGDQYLLESDYKAGKRFFGCNDPFGSEYGVSTWDQIEGMTRRGDIFKPSFPIYEHVTLEKYASLAHKIPDGCFFRYKDREEALTKIESFAAAALKSLKYETMNEKKLLKFMIERLISKTNHTKKIYNYETC